MRPTSLSKILAAAVALTALLAPGLAFAQRSCGTQTISCPEGSTYDSESQACLPPPTS